MDPAGDIKIMDPAVDLPEGKDGFNLFNNLRDKNKNLKTLISIGGRDEGSVDFSAVAADADKRKLFADNALKFVKEYKFDGLDVSWQYPGERGGDKADKANFVLMLKEIKEKFEKDKLLLSIAVGSNSTLARIAYDIPEISKYVDWMNFMSFDFSDMTANVTSFNAPLYGSNEGDTWDIVSKFNLIRY